MYSLFYKIEVAQIDNYKVVITILQRLYNNLTVTNLNRCLVKSQFLIL